MTGEGKTIKQRLKSLERHLKKENPVLVAAVQSYRELDRVGRALGMIDSEQSFATQISWWPMISVLGTFSAGKSTFINHYLGESLQSTGNQAVDDKFTVICFGSEHGSQAIPGTALNADPRFTFYQISNELEKVAQGEGRRVDAYLQLKTSPSSRLRGKVIIDSPGFDADSQRTATLRLTDHIVDLSDLVLVFFDARHPEPGAMRDTLAHLVGKTIMRPDATKFVYILNQMDTTAREDNPEEVVGAWQRALAQEGLTAGRFYCIYNPDVAVPIVDEALRKRYEGKRNHDLSEIHER
ncbi:MAG: dynamin family protein, partial [Gammaproteobacteria bacterium]